MPIARDSKLETRDARSKLKQRHAPYWRTIHKGLAIGLRKGPGGNVWIARKLTDGEYKFKTLGSADDYQDANGVDVLSYAEATRAAFAFADEKVITSTYTVREGGEEYIGYLRTHKKSAEVMGAVLNAHVYPKFGDRPIAKLTQDEIQVWVDELPLQPPRRVSNTRHKPVTDAERMRQRKATANRIWSVFRGLLNYAYEKKRIAENSAWKGVKSFENVDGSRKVFLQPDQAQRLINIAQGAFRRYVRALLYTGCRPGKEIEGPRVKDFDAVNKSLHLPDSKTGSRDVYLTDDGAEFFAEITTGRHPDEQILLDDDGGQWENNALDRAMRKAVKLAKLPADTVLYSLRHTYISLALKNGMNIKALADNCGTSIAMIESNYGKFLSDDRRRMLNAALPSFDPPRSNVVALR